MKKALVCLVVALLGLLAPRAQAGDPLLQWYTIETPHFRVTYHGGLEPVAQRAAVIAERAYELIGRALDQEPSEVVEILLTDDSELANGSASAVPYDRILLYVTAPDDMSALGDYDDWLNVLITHEYAHILHVDNVSGLPALLNRILGKTAAPNHTQPRWILEGLAVTLETEHTTGGRLRSSQFDMFLRADVLEGKFARLDEMSGSPRRFPGANLWYLYGSGFVSFIHETYGPHVFAAVADDYGAQVVAYGINRAIRRVTGKTYEELYEAWRRTLERRYAAQAASIRARGLREGKRLTHRGQSASSPRLTGECSTLGKPSVALFRDDGHTTPGIYEIALDGSNPEGVLRARSSGLQLGFAPDCSIVFDSGAISQRRYAFLDLFRQLPGTSSREEDATRARLTQGLRARHADVSPDGRRIVLVTNDRGTSTLRIAELTPNWEVSQLRTLVPSARYEQAYTPRFSPDGKSVAYSAWTSGGFRDIRVVDVASGRVRQITRDRAVDQHPVFSRDGERLYFVSDRSGVANVYVQQLTSGRLAQVTNVINGAYFPELSADERTLLYVGYTAAGWDLFTLDNDPERWLEPQPYVDRRGAGTTAQSARHYPARPYRALPTLQPRRYFVEYGPGAFGDQLEITTEGSDIAGLHAIAAAVTIPTDLDRPEPSLQLDYAYGRLPFGFQLSGFRSAAPRNDYEYSERRPPIVEHLTGITTGVSLGAPGDGESQYVSLSYTVAEFAQRLPLGSPDPYAPRPREPHSGLLGLLHLGYGYYSSEGTAYAISRERGFDLSVGADYADRVLGSETTLTSFSATLTGYFSIPWLDHHVLALALSGGTGSGTYPRRGLFSIGGFADLPLLDAFTSNLRQSAFRLRGYAPGQFVGNDFNLLNAEYRFPIWYADRGISTLPAFLRTVSGAAFFDMGAAYNELDLKDPLASFHQGVGAELWLELLFGYYVSGNVRLGVAKGLSDVAPSGLQTYTVVSAGF